MNQEIKEMLAQFGIHNPDAVNQTENLYKKLIKKSLDESDRISKEIAPLSLLIVSELMTKTFRQDAARYRRIND